MNQALELIAQAKQTHATRLDLGNCGLTELPDALFELIGLEELILTNGWFEFVFEEQRWERFNSQNTGNPNNFKSISPKIKLLRGLKKLMVTGWNTKWALSDLSPLKDLTALQLLNISATQVSDLSPLKNLTNLRQLDISGTQVNDLSPLKNLTALQMLIAHWTPVNDLSPLKNLTTLQELQLDHTKVNDLSPLKDLTALQILNVWATQVSDLSPLKDLMNLQELYVSFNLAVNDLSPLKNLTALQKLGINHTKVSDLSPLKDLTALQHLIIGYTKVSDLSPLKDLIRKGLQLFGEFNTFSNPPYEIVKKGNEAILRYWAEQDSVDK